MYNVIFYETSDGVSEMWSFMQELEERIDTDKDARIQYNQISLCIFLLKEKGTRMGKKLTKYIGDGIWELRPGFNRVLYFYYKDDTFVLLHQFRKQTRKTPRQEIEKAKRERNDWIERKESEDENLG